MNIINNGKTEYLIILIEDINDNLIYVDKELPGLNLPKDVRESIQKLIDRFQSKIFDLRNMLSIIYRFEGAIIIDPLIEETEDMSEEEATRKFLLILTQENDKLCELTDRINEIKSEEDSDIGSLKILLNESSGNILLSGVKIRAKLRELLSFITNNN